MDYSRQTPAFLWIVGLSRQLSRLAGSAVRKWSYPNRIAIGDQFIRAVDSIGLNLSEGYARAHRKDQLRFYTIAEGSLEEAIHALRVARDRGLFSRIEVSMFFTLLYRLSSGIQRFKNSIPRSVVY